MAGSIMSSLLCQNFSSNASIQNISEWNTYAAARVSTEGLSSFAASRNMSGFTGYNNTWIRINSGFASSGTMWGSPANTPAHVTYDSTINRVLQHAVESSAAWSGIITNTLPVLVQLTFVGGFSTSELSRNGYTSVSYAVYDCMRCDAVEFFNTDLGLGRKCTFPGLLYEDIV